MFQRGPVCPSFFVNLRASLWMERTWAAPPTEILMAMTIARYHIYSNGAPRTPGTERHAVFCASVVEGRVQDTWDSVLCAGIMKVGMLLKKWVMAAASGSVRVGWRAAHITRWFPSGCRVRVAEKGAKVGWHMECASAAGIRFRTPPKPEPNPNHTRIQVQALQKNQTKPQPIVHERGVSR
ncbi:hypothetical protein B0H14DRAFT_2577613 [Mycena olivaceomarginata]|nr:hypothetical protein B0H14DRAFT_2577613 [Mycena olivaceomarginata]